MEKLVQAQAAQLAGEIRAHLIERISHRRGGGLQHGVHLAARLNHGGLHLGALRTEAGVNGQMITLYDRSGFNEIGRRPRYYPAHHGREDAIVMAMELLD